MDRNYQGAQVVFDKHVTHQMDIINGLKPRENLLSKAIIGAVSKKMIETLDDEVYHDREKRVLAELGKAWLPDQ